MLSILTTLVYPRTHLWQSDVIEGKTFTKTHRWEALTRHLTTTAMDPTGLPPLSKYVETQSKGRLRPAKVVLRPESRRSGFASARGCPGWPAASRPRPISAAWAALAARLYLGYTGLVCLIGAKPDFVTERWIDGDDRLNQVTSHNGVAFTRLFDRV